LAYENKLHTKTAKKMWEEIQKSNPFDWMSAFSTQTMIANSQGKIK
jgi:hypothetical protein